MVCRRRKVFFDVTFAATSNWTGKVFEPGEPSPVRGRVSGDPAPYGARLAGHRMKQGKLMNPTTEIIESPRCPVLASRLVLQNAKVGAYFGAWFTGITGLIVGALVAYLLVSSDEPPPLSRGADTFFSLICVAFFGFHGATLGATVGWLLGGIRTLIGIVVFRRAQSLTEY